MDLDELLDAQAGVVARFQALDGGLDGDFIRRRRRRREWVRLHRCVYLNHTGPPTWTQFAWAAVLHCWPAALADESALVALGLGLQSPVGPVDRPLIHVAVDQSRRLAPSPGIRMHRVVDLGDLVQANLSPPRVRLEHALVSVASRQRSDDAAIACLADGCQSRRTTPERLARALRRNSRLRRRRFLLEIVEDVAAGAYSALEHRYLTRVERAHGLPTARRQRRVRPGRGPAYRDVEYVGLGLVVELDGRLGHEATGDRWGDLDRDIDSLVEGATTARVGWRQVLQPCRLAVSVSRLLHALGWKGTPRPCGVGCPVGGLLPGADAGALGSPGGASTPTSEGRAASAG